jgi:hypothetical protein
MRHLDRKKSTRSSRYKWNLPYRQHEHRNNWLAEIAVVEVLEWNAR